MGSIYIPYTKDSGLTARTLVTYHSHDSLCLLHATEASDFDSFFRGQYVQSSHRDTKSPVAVIVLIMS